MNAGSLTFASPELLLALLLVPIALVAYLLLQRRRNRYVVRFTNVALLENLVPRRPSWRRHVPTAFYLAAIAVLGIALARPSLVVPVPREEATVVLTMDTSRSMLATDVAPDRLTAAKAAASDFIASLPEGFRVALVAFSTEARLVMPPTTDRAQVQAALDALRADGGTALGDAIALSLEAADLATGVVGAPAVAPSSPVPGDPRGACPVTIGVTGRDGRGAAAGRHRAAQRRRELHRRPRAPRCRRRCRDPGRSRVHDRTRHRGRDRGGSERHGRDRDASRPA